jgi:hypothetical protein
MEIPGKKTTANSLANDEKFGMHGAKLRDVCFKMYDL